MASKARLNLIQLDIPTADLAEIDAALDTLETKLAPKLINLTAEERSTYYKMGKREQIVRDAVNGAVQNPNDIPASVGTADAQADLAALDDYRPLFARVAKINDACQDSELALGVDLINFALRVYGILTISAPASLKNLLGDMSSFFGRGPRGGKDSSSGSSSAPAK